MGVKCGFRQMVSMRDSVNKLCKSLVIPTTRDMSKFQSMNTCLVELCNNIFMVSSCFLLFNPRVNESVVVFLVSICYN